MKRFLSIITVTVILLCLGSSACASSFVFDGEITFASSLEEIIAHYGKEPYDQGEQYLFTNVYLGDFPAHIIFAFESQSLYDIVVFISVIDSDAKLNYMAFTVMDDYLETNYGNPTITEYLGWEQNQADYQPITYGEAVQNGDLKIMSQWEIDGVSIGHMLENIDGETVHTVLFSKENTAQDAVLSTVVLSSGEWECPDHIAAGEYTVTPQKSASIMVFRNDKLTIGEYLSTKDDDEIGRLVLQAGDRIEISGGKLSFEPFGQ